MARSRAERLSVVTPHVVEASVTMQPIAVDTGRQDRDGMLVMANGMLVGVLVRHDDPDNEQQTGGWFAEAVFGRLHGSRPPPFGTLDEATRWFRMRHTPQLA